MQTLYYTTPNFIRHTGSVVDLSEYRRKLALAQEGSPAPQSREEVRPSAGHEEEPFPPLREIRPRRARKARRPLLLLDACASLCVVVMTITFTLRILMG